MKKRERERAVDSLCHSWFTTTHLSYRFPILKLPPRPCAVLLVLQVPSTFFKMQVLGLMLHLWRSQCDSYFLVISPFFAGEIFASLYRHPTHTISMTSNDSFYRSVSGFSLLKSNGSFALQSIFNLPIKNRVCWWVKLNPNLFQLPFPNPFFQATFEGLFQTPRPSEPLLRPSKMPFS